jgi:HD-GYP domain-containing protein (c-di-GMP phosphodiesterase class II)
MDLDSYETPEGETLLLSAKQRHAGRRSARRVLLTEVVSAGVFLVGAVLVAVLSDQAVALGATALVLTVVAYLVAARVRFPVGSAWTAPTQLVFVPMLFVLPTPLVPLIVAGCSVADLGPDALHGRASITRVAACIADSFYSLGPVLVLVLTGHQLFSWNAWPVYLLAFAAQVALDGATGLARTWFAERIKPAEQVQMVWLYVTDACFSCAGIAVASAAVTHEVLVLLTLPLIGLLSLFAHERNQRLDSTLELSSAYRGAAQLLGDVIDAVDHYTGMHTRQVVELSVEVTLELGFDATHHRDVEFAAMLHDVGKIRVPTEIINKPGKLDADEWEIMRRHTIDGEAMLQQVGGTLAGVGRLVRASHERYDGQGYPDGLVGEAIPIESRIVCVCDAFNAMTTDRPYRSARRAHEALEELHRCAGTQFDPAVVEAVEHVLRRRYRRSGPNMAPSSSRTGAPAELREHSVARYEEREGTGSRGAGSAKARDAPPAGPAPAVSQNLVGESAT